MLILVSSSFFESSTLTSPPSLLYLIAFSIRFKSPLLKSLGSPIILVLDSGTDTSKFTFSFFDKTIRDSVTSLTIGLRLISSVN